MLKLQELMRSLFGPNPEEIIRFCGVATFVQRLQQDSSESTNKQWKDMQLVIFCICSLCSPRVTPLYLFSHMDRQSFLAHDGIQTLDMLSLGFGPNKDRFSS